MPEPYYSDEHVTLYRGDCREIVPALALTVDLIVADPPYEETSYHWDRWQAGWPTALSGAAKSMWCFGSMRMFLDRVDEFGPWKLSQDVVWEKHNGSGFATDRFRRVHEHALHWYQGVWGDVRHEVPRIAGEARPTATVRARSSIDHTNQIAPARYEYGDTRLAKSVIYARSMHGLDAGETEKPPGILVPLIEYGCAPGGVVLDPFAGSGSTGDAARLIGRSSVLIEAREEKCESIARRMSQGVLA